MSPAAKPYLDRLRVMTTVAQERVRRAKGTWSPLAQAQIEEEAETLSFALTFIESHDRSPLPDVEETIAWMTDNPVGQGFVLLCDTCVEGFNTAQPIGEQRVRAIGRLSCDACLTRLLTPSREMGVAS